MMTQATLKQDWKTEDGDMICQAVSKFFYGHALPFHLMKSPYLPLCWRELQVSKMGLKPLTYHENMNKSLKT